MTQFNDKIADKNKRLAADKQAADIQKSDDKRAAAVMQAVTLSAAEQTKLLRSISQSETDIKAVLEQIRSQETPELAQFTDKLSSVLTTYLTRLEKLQQIDLKDLPEAQKRLATALDNLPRTIDVTDGSDKVVAAVEALGNMQVAPEVTVQAPDVRVDVPKLDVSPIVSALKALKQPDVHIDVSDLQSEMAGVEKAVRDLIARPIPVPETPLPYITTDNKAIQPNAVESADTAGVFGVVALNPDGSAISAGGGGGGKQYADQDPAPDNPIFTAIGFNNGGDMTAISDVTALPVSLNEINVSGLPTYDEQLRQSGFLETLTATQAVIIDDTTTPDTTYIGKAAVGSSTSDPVWQVAKLDTSSGLTKTWAGTAGFDQVWDDRASLTYN